MEPTATTRKISPLAATLNATIAAKSPATHHLLSPKGKSLFFPTKGIASQATEAKQKSNPHTNATIGIAKAKGAPIGFASIAKYFSNELTADEIFNYSNSFGNPVLRKLWKERLIELNPLLADQPFSLPIVTAGLTHSVYIAAELFLTAGQRLILPDQIWGNYRLMFNVIENIELTYFPFYHNNGFNLAGFQAAIQAEGDRTGSVRTLLNFPNNPTGYSPTPHEAAAIVKSLVEIAQQGIKVVVFLDEAYFGLFFAADVYRHSLFAQLAGAHENILAIKICGATKEFFAWGLRIGFFTLATAGGTPELYTALEQKAVGSLRGNISNCSTVAQNILSKVLASQAYKKDFAANYDLLASRVAEVKRVLANNDYSAMFTPYPFNSGYFMLVRLQPGLDAEKIRTHLLEHEKVGVIATSPSHIRIAFSCLEKEHIELVFNLLYKTCKAFAS